MKTLLRTTTTSADAILSEALISAVEGEFYNYDYKFVLSRPVFALLKCKSNKGRPVKSLADLGTEANMLFMFGDGTTAEVWPVQLANSAGVLGSKFNEEHFGNTYVGITDLSGEQFHAIRDEQDTHIMVMNCRCFCNADEKITVKQGDVFAAMTDSGKYGLFHVQEVGSDHVLINACHILLR
ncbi:MAG: hypothetical protein QG614_140 [Patescibacteria group bacterium]|nr:hypothetical protein [Patescibacteria group bacterium]